ncbi:hypothetical protein [Nocardia jiangsuensis]|uniref:Excreted virulence factor EspC (Type VII ESX diderm) n=1 Tax=Nocardia jiangsuensis TaxID=1691563 RepID=A0ABV8DXQ6_9NOCA
MDKTSADTDGIVAYGASAQIMAGEMAAAGTSAAGAGPALLGPIMGLIGGDFMAAYATAHAGQVAAIGQLSAVLTSMGGSVTAAAGAIADTELGSAAAIAPVDPNG